MLDIKAVRDDPERFRQALARRELAGAVDELLEADERRRALTVQVDELRAEQNKASKAIGRADGDDKQRLIDEVARVSAELKQIEPQLAEADAAMATLLAATPNLPHESAPDGFTDDDAVEVRRHLEPPSVRLRDRRTTPSSARRSACSIPSAARARAGHDSCTCSATSSSCSSP